LHFAGEVIEEGVNLLRKPLPYIIFLWVSIFVIAQAFIVAGRSLCSIPLLQNTGLCLSQQSNTGQSGSITHHADFPSLVNIQSQSFEALLDRSAGGSELFLTLKKAELAVTDLVILVKLSKLDEKDLLADSLTNFCNEAQAASRGLQQFTTKIAGSVDQILAFNVYAFNTINNARTPSISSTVNPFYIHPNVEEAAVEVFNEVTTTLVTNVAHLITVAEEQLAHLERLEEQINLIHDIVFKEDFLISSAKDELLSELWTKLGGNQRILRSINGHLKLLNGVGEYRRQAKAYVASALQALRTLSDELEGLRERVSGPHITGTHFPVEIHIESISYGIQRLRQTMIEVRKHDKPAIAPALDG
ncbi:hypothetical protein GYMLUDRAFT_173802, partial [Collybiopsis luxurians FD-317 M1]